MYSVSAHTLANILMMTDLTEERRENMSDAISTIGNFLNPVWVAIQGFWTDVLVPFGTNVGTWAETKTSGVIKFADFCTQMFRVEYQIRIVSFILIMGFLILSIPFIIMPKFRRRRRRRKCMKKSSKR